MEKLNPIWFLKHPLDPEHKSYILLDKLKEYQQELKKDQISSTIGKVLTIIKDLNRFKKEGMITKESYESLDEGDKKVLTFYKNLTKGDVEFNELHEVINKCLEILYRYANIGVDLLNERNSKIKTFEIIPPSETKGDNNFGYLFIRNMVTDEIFTYFWSESEMRNESGINQVGIGMRRINTVDPTYFSLSYIHIAHEILDKSMSIKPKKTPRILVCEISENFQENSEIIKAAKDKFLEKLSNEKGKLI